jgi:serine/threonine protein kinase
MANSGRDLELFTEAIQLPIEERNSFLDRACGQDKHLRGKIEALLRSNERLGAFLEQPPTVINGGSARALPIGEKPGDTVGRYRLLQQLGEGGCGIVFLAEQQEPVQRRVALKVIKPGMDTKSVIARFEAERQALAMMEHPNIARIFDAGATESGRPYFVMELVEGVKITDYCRQHLLPLTDRLELFLEVSEAIQHAHQKGIIHRDIKPSNILVTTGPERKPVPKVIDFGIAKATTGQQLTDKTIFTALEMLLGTPAYMSPEQAAFTSADVDTRTDIYSLGVLLYELLTSTTPFDTQKLLKAGLDEVRRVIRDEEPVRPSTRLSTMIAEDLANVSKHHQVDVPKLIREMSGDLDWIVMKALEKDRARRYQTTNSLAQDIRCYLDNETVSARQPSRFYQFQKLVLRHKLEFAAIGVVLTILLAGLAVTTWSLSNERRAHRDAEISRLDANQQRKKAEIGEANAVTEAARSSQAMEFLRKTLTSVSPAVANGRDTTLLREMLDSAMTNMALELTNQPGVQADLKLTIGQVYIPLGRGDKAEPLLVDALAFYRKSPASFEQQISDTLSELCLLHMHTQPARLKEAEEEIREALDIQNKLAGKPNMRLVVMHTRLGFVILLLQKPADAAELFRDALEEGKRLVGNDSEQLLSTRGGLAMALTAQNKFVEAAELLGESLSIERKKLGAEHPYVANELFRLAGVLDKQGRPGEVETLLRECLAIRRKTLPADHPRIDETLAELADVLVSEGKMANASDTYREILNLRRKKFGDEDARVLLVVRSLTGALLADGKQSEFEQLAAQFTEAFAASSEYWAQQGVWTQAVAAASRFVDLRPNDHSAYHLMAPLLVQTGQHAAYENLCQKIAARFAGATDFYTADRMAKDCLILPRPGADLKIPAELAETAVTRGRADPATLPFFQCCKALAQFRLGYYTDAVEWAQKAAKGPLPHSQAQAAAILAMSQVKMNQLDNARAALASCDHVIEEKLPKLEEGIGKDWRDWIIAHVLQSEAKCMIDGVPTAAADPTNVH